MLMMPVSTVFFYNITVDEAHPSRPSVELTYDPVRYSAGQGSYSGEVNIPETVTINDVEYQVIGIGAETFRFSQDLESIDYSPTIYYIGDKAFQGCSKVPLYPVYEYGESGDLIAKYVMIPKNVYVGDMTFSESGLETIIYEGLSCGIAAFKDCKSLKTVDWRSTESISDECFSGCEMLEQVHTKCDYIGAHAFAGCINIKSGDDVIGGVVTLDIKNATTIGEYAFEGCTGLKRIDIPHTVQSIDRYAFKDCTSLKSVFLSGYTLYSSGFELASSDLKIDSPETVFNGCTAIEYGLIGRRVVSDYNGTLCDPFKGVNLTDIQFGGTCVESPFNGADYPALESVSCSSAIPPKVAGFTDAQYKNVRLYVPNEYRGEYEISAPWNKFQLTGSTNADASVIFEHNGLYYAADSYYGTGADVSIIRDPYGKEYSGDFTVDEAIAKYGVSYTPVKVEAKAFYDCTGLKSISLPGTVRLIGHSAFCNTGLTSVDLSKNEDLELEIGAFDSCEELREVKMSSYYGIMIFPKYAFSNCRKLEIINFTEAGNAIFENEAFAGCVSLSDKMDFSSIISAHFSGGAFAGCAFTELELPAEANFSHGNNMQPAFAGNLLKKIIVHKISTNTAIFCDSRVQDKPVVDCLTVKGGISISSDDEPYALKNTCWLTDGKVRRVILDLSEMSNPDAHWLDRSWIVDEIECLLTTPPVIGEFSEEQYKSTIVYVPEGCVDVYKSDVYWQKFLNIKEHGSAGVESIEADATTCIAVDGGIMFKAAKQKECYKIYTATGLLIAAGVIMGNDSIVSVVPGCYIVTFGDQISKVCVK